MKRCKQIVLLLAVLAIGLALTQLTALGQCSMCKASLAGSQNAAFIRQFNIGVLVLLVPPVAMFVSFFVLLRRNRGADDASDQSKYNE